MEYICEIECRNICQMECQLGDHLKKVNWFHGN